MPRPRQTARRQPRRAPTQTSSSWISVPLPLVARRNRSSRAQRSNLGHITQANARPLPHAMGVRSLSRGAALAVLGTFARFLAVLIATLARAQREPVLHRPA